MPDSTGKIKAQCPACGSADLLKPDRLTAESLFGGGDLRVEVRLTRGPNRVTYRKSPLQATVCVTCGHVQLRATNLEALASALAELRSRVPALPRSSRRATR
jgi:Zn ribbon nucleic-acid-binding protein